MCFALLSKLSAGVLPAALKRQDEVEQAQVLRAAGLAMVLFVMERDDHGVTQREARVLAITPEGRHLLLHPGAHPVKGVGAAVS